MIEDPLLQILILLAAAVVVVTIARRLGLPAILGYLAVGMALGTHAVGIFVASDTTNLLAELGVVFLLFTLGLEFSWPRMIAMRREVFGLGSVQVFLTCGAFVLIGALFGVPLVLAIVLGGAVAMSSTAIILHQLTDQAELNRTHGRLAFAVLLFQDLAAIPQEWLSYCQPCDAPADGPDSSNFDAIIDDAINRRMALGKGGLPLAAMVDALPDHLPMAVEERSAALRDNFPDLIERAREVARTSRAWLEARG